MVVVPVVLEYIYDDESDTPDLYSLYGARLHEVAHPVLSVFWLKLE